MKPSESAEKVTCNVCGKTLGRNDLRGQRLCRRHYHLSNRNPQQYLAEVRAWKEDPRRVVNVFGCGRAKPVDYGVITERGSLDGVPISVGGKTSHVILEEGGKTYSGIDLDRDLAKRLARCLYDKTVRLHGIGRWQRHPDGQWELKKFRVDNFEILGDATLSEIVEELRSVPGSGWDDREKETSPLEKGPLDHDYTQKGQIRKNP